jgi:hypothetical protein
MKNALAYTNLVLVIVAMVVGFFVRNNPILFGLNTGKIPSDDDFAIYRDHPLMDVILNMHKSELGKDYESYRNHCLRVLSFAVHHLGGNDNLQPGDLDIMAIALAYHDIALWTDGALSYLEPSVAVMEREMKERFKRKEAGEEKEEQSLFSLSENDIATVREIVLQHHKFRQWTPEEGNPADARLVNAVRKGDWADATVGVIRYCLPASYVQAAYTTVPEAGFHMVLAGMGGRLSPDSLVGQLDVLKIFKW